MRNVTTLKVLACKNEELLIHIDSKIINSLSNAVPHTLCS
jgi:hypothetical protein